MNWEAIYNYFGITDFIYFISSSQIQDTLFPIKLVFVGFSMFFLAAVIYFMMNSSWLQYKFIEDVTEFFSWEAYGLKAISRRWNRIQKKVNTGLENEYKLAVIEADDFLTELLEDRGYNGNTFEELAMNAGKAALQDMDKIFEAHDVRNTIVHNPDFKLDESKVKSILIIYESAIKNIGAS